MAPERFDGRSLPQSDVYGLGVTLYELLTLRPAFDDTNKARLVEKVLHEPPLPPRKLDPHIPRDLETAVLKCLAKDPADRYASAEAVAEDLQRFLADRPIKARRTPWHERSWRWCRRNPAVATLLAAVAVSLIGFATVSTLYAAHLKAAAVDLTAALSGAEKAGAEARLREAEALVGQAHGIRHSRRPGQRFDALAALHKAAAIGRELDQPPDWFDTLRNEAIAALALPDLHITHSWDGFPPGTRDAGVSEDFELYARITDQGACSVHRVADNVEIAHLSALGDPENVSFGPGHLLAVHGNSGRWQLWDLAGAVPALRFDQRDPVNSWSFSPDGRLVVLGHRDGSLAVYTTSGVCKHRLAAKDIITRLNSPSLHPSEPIVAVSSYLSPWVHIRDLRTGAVLVALKPWLPPRPRGANGSAGCTWSPDGRTLAVSEGDGGRVKLYAYDPAPPGLRLTRTLEGPGNGGTAVRFNPAGDRVFTHGWDRRIHLFDPATGRLLFSTHSSPAIASISLQVDPSGRRLGATRVGAHMERIGLWSVADAREYRSLVQDGSGHSAHPESYAVHPGGRLAAQGFTGGLALFDLETGRQLAFVRVPRGVGNVCFDGAGNLITNSFAGAFRWPVRPAEAQPGRMTVGPPERLPFYPSDRPIATGRGGDVIAQAQFNGYGGEPYVGGWILHPGSQRPRWVEAATGMDYASVSPDGRWVAFGVHATRVNVYEAASGKRVWQSPVDHLHDYCRFSRDGLWLIADNDGGRAYSVGSWEPGPRLGSGVPWDISPDSRVVVMGQSDGIYRLVERATGRELARLEDPDQIAWAATFTPDGTRLVVGAKEGLRVWDLRRVRAELVKLGLDWDAPAYPPAPERAADPLEVQVEGGDLDPPQAPPANQEALQTLLAVHSLQAYWAPCHPEPYRQRGYVYLELGQPDKAIEDFTQALRWQPPSPKEQALLHISRANTYLHIHKDAEAAADLQKALDLDPHPTAFNNLAQIYVNGPTKLRDPAKALAIAGRGLHVAPDDWHCRNTLGVAHYRLGQYDQAVVALERSLRESNGERAAFQLYFLAMCHARLGDAARAKECYDEAVRWNPEAPEKLPPNWGERIRTIRAEAEAVLAETGKR
jgi:WD40 repeat protein/Tfp pilus assembly protein PilF